MKDSSFIKDVKWVNNSLFVRLKSGKFYEYQNVPEQVYLDCIKADSIGNFFTEFIKGVYSYKAFVEPTNTLGAWPFPKSAKP